MARVDDYKQARRIAVATLAAQDPPALIDRSGFDGEPGKYINVPFLNRHYQIDWPEFTFTDSADATAEVPLQEQVLILHYLMSESKRPPTGNWIAYREIPGAGFYYGAFVKRAIDPLKKIFGNDTAALKKSARLLEATPADTGDAGFDVTVFPNVPLRLILWQGDDEFPPDASILFDETAGDYLSPEDAAWLAGMVVYRLAALSRA
ncbi:MAG: DUF3786 domain-containing protein [Desulfobacterales bacterium]